MATSEWLPFGGPSQPDEPSPDAAARVRAVDPAFNVVLEASAGTGKTQVLVERYLNLLGRGVDPTNILAITFTRKAAAEMRERILAELRRRAGGAAADGQLWRDAYDRAGDIAISTIDAFCLSLLHEFPLEADLDPGFDMADETLVLRIVEEALNRALDVGRGLARTDANVRLLFAELREPRLRDALGAMLDRRLVVETALERALGDGPRDLTAELACERAFEKLRAVFNALTGGVEGFLANGPVHHRRWDIFTADLRLLSSGVMPDPGLARGMLDRIGGHFLNKDGQPRQRFDGFSARDCRSADAWKVHRSDVTRLGSEVADALKGFRRDLNAMLSRGVRRLYQIALSEYRRTLDSYGVLDFSETLARAIALLAQMDEFARSRYRLEGRYHHVLLDEFQDTSRAQWSLVSLLIGSWAEGSGVAEDAQLSPSIFLVGDRKQSIYGFRDADVAVIDEAGIFIDMLRPDPDSRRAISRSFRAVPPLLAFANDLFGEVEKDDRRRDAFRYREQDQFPVEPDESGQDALGIVAASTVTECADAVAGEIRRLVDAGEPIRDPSTRLARPIACRDIAILFRTRDNHQEFEKALERQGVPSYVYRGLGFFDADEIKDVLALLRYLAAPDSDLRAAALLRSRFVRLSDRGLQILGPHLASSLASPSAAVAALDSEDRSALEAARAGVARWLALVDRIPPAELLELVLDETAYLFETRGVRVRQARENLKKMKAMIRRVQNRGYVTMARLAQHLERLSAGDESNAVIDAGDSVSLMTIHAAKGLEFPVVFVVNLGRGTGNRRPAIRVVSDDDQRRAWLSVGDFQSEADEDARAKDREETKRLLYVAVTRARDRLYLASEVKEGRFKAFGGSLGDVLPRSMARCFEAAASVPRPATATWAAASAQTHTFRVCDGPAGDGRAADASGASGPAPASLTTSDEFGPLVDLFAIPRQAVTAALSRESAPIERRRFAEADRRISGTLVHRVFERFGASLAQTQNDSRVSLVLDRLLRDEGVGEIPEADAVVRQATAAYLSLCSHPDVTAALAAGDALFEVPFTVRTAASPAILRGSFDCLVTRRDGGFTLLELKTGRPSPEDESQLSAYLAAARALFPGVAVDGKLVYAWPDDRARLPG